MPGANGQSATKSREDARLSAEIQAIFLENRQVYGSPRIHAARPRMRDTLWTQAGGAADASSGATSQAASKAETLHNQK
jgi:hypothetical protein